MTHLKVGDHVPDFNLKDENEKIHKLEDYKDQKLILFFYPRDQTPGCTAEACNLRDNYLTLRQQGFHILGISPDNSKKHKKFVEKYGFQYSLLADTERKMIQDYGVWGPKLFFGKAITGLHRTTFIIDGAGVISHIITKVKTKDHAKQILDLM